ncbi:hypothetical protein [Sulfuriflexus mobilis]|uniref:hypothetical protein n=1 Tax=Sulfuriflexus mobilis TaxID=1811807 RepID=UPI000F848E17|nr:hypothetical protein [Sulfuriflexus mobilis]
MQSEVFEIIKFYSLDIILLIVPVSYIIGSTIKGFETKTIVMYGAVISIVTGLIVQVRYPGHAHVPGSEVFFVVLVSLVCFAVMAICILLRKLYLNGKNT